ncbi:hypothetical protein Tco_1255694 [Tanacetum coccineum]
MPEKFPTAGDGVLRFLRCGRTDGPGKMREGESVMHLCIRVDEDLHNLSSVEAEFPALVINDAVAPQDELQCKSQISTPVNDEIDFRISFDETDDKDYTILFDKNSFSYKKISVNDLKTNSENDYEKVMPSIPSLEPAISCFDDLDFFTDFENEFSVIVYNDAQTSKSDLLTEPILNPQHIDEFDLNDKTSLSEYDEEEQNVLYFNDLFPFNIIRLDNLKSEKDNGDSKIDIILSFEDNEYTHGSTTVFETSHDKNTKNFRPGNFIINLNLRIVIWIHYANGMLFFLIKNLCAPFGVPFSPKRYYKDGVYVIMLQRPRSIRHMALPPPRIHRREVHRVSVFDFGGLLDLMAEGLNGRMLMEHRDEAGVSVFTSRAWRRMFDIRRHMSWRQFILALGLHTEEEMQTARDFLGTSPSYTLIRDPILTLCHRLIACSIVGRSQAPEKVTLTDLFYLRGMDVGSVNVPYLLARYLRLFAAGRKSRAYISGGQFIARLTEHFKLLTTEILGELTVITPELLVIDMAELVRLQIYVELEDTWAWVAMGPERQPVVAAGAPAVAEDAPIIDEGGQDDLTPDQAPQQPHPPPPAHDRTMPQRMFSTWVTTGLERMMDMAGVAYTPYAQTHVSYQRRVRQRTGEAITSAAQQDPQQPDP